MSHLSPFPSFTTFKVSQLIMKARKSHAGFSSQLYYTHETVGELYGDVLLIFPQFTGFTADAPGRD